MFGIIIAHEFNFFFHFNGQENGEETHLEYLKNEKSHTDTRTANRQTDTQAQGEHCQLSIDKI